MRSRMPDGSRGFKEHATGNGMDGSAGGALAPISVRIPSRRGVSRSFCLWKSCHESAFSSNSSRMSCVIVNRRPFVLQCRKQKCGRLYSERGWRQIVCRAVKGIVLRLFPHCGRRSGTVLFRRALMAGTYSILGEQQVRADDNCYGKIFNLNIILVEVIHYVDDIQRASAYRPRT